MQATFSLERIDSRIKSLIAQLTAAMKHEPEKRREMVRRQIVGRIKELQRIKSYLTGGVQNW
jgi:hypothetical protein